MWPRLSLTVGVVAAIVFVSPAATALAQQPVDPVISQLDERVATFLESVKQGSIKAAYTKLLAGSQLATQTKDLETLTADTAEKIKTQFGEYRAFERVYEKRVGNDLVFLKYLYKCSYFPVLWHITFYRPPVRAELGPESSGTWQVIAIRFDTDLEVLTLLKD